jgi:hypothetical protein
MYVRKDAKINATLDLDAARVLTTIADREAEGNRSLALRLLLREAGARRGLLVTPAAAVNHAEVRSGQPA